MRDAPGSHCSCVQTSGTASVRSRFDTGWHARGALLSGVLAPGAEFTVMAAGERVAPGRGDGGESAWCGVGPRRGPLRAEPPDAKPIAIEVAMAAK